MREPAMKPGRKHGGKVRSDAKVEVLPSCLSGGQDRPSLMGRGKRIKTSVSRAPSRGAYLWFTDRGRSKLLLKF